MSNSPVIVWYRNDLRVADHAALHAASQRRLPVLPVYVWSPDEEGRWPPGAASRYWLHHALARLRAELRERGTELVLARGEAADVLARLARDTRAEAVHWNRRYEPAAREQQQAVAARLESEGIEGREFQGNLLVEPDALATRDGKPYRVFTPFWKRWEQEVHGGSPLPAPGRLDALANPPRSASLETLGLEPAIDWADGIRTEWNLDGNNAHDYLASFVDGEIENYVDRRDLPHADAVSRLSPFLHFGELSPREAWSAAVDAHRGGGRLSPDEATAAWLRQLAWREFAHHLLWHFPHTTEKPLHAQFAHFPWLDRPGHAEAWRRGRTGYPLVDAGMRELWVTGWMHNRVRMVAGSFLVKHLRQHWLVGAEWFWDTLVDADLANNSMGWQWVAGSGADAAPYFRIFNPVAQGERFDPHGRYLRRWLPALAKLPDTWLHRPWEAPADVLSRAGVRLGEDYPEPIVDHAEARQAALDAYQHMRDVA